MRLMTVFFPTTDPEYVVLRNDETDSYALRRFFSEKTDRDYVVEFQDFIPRSDYLHQARQLTQCRAELRKSLENERKLVEEKQTLLKKLRLANEALLKEFSAD